MHRVLLLGSGKIGRLMARILSAAGDYDLTVADCHQAKLDRLRGLERTRTRTLDAADPSQLAEAMQGNASVISALSYQFNVLVAEVAVAQGLSYFDLTEDRATTDRVAEVARKAGAGQVLVPQCGLAPGFVSIAAHALAKDFDKLDSVRIRVGALPIFPTNALSYNLTWSTDGVINQYCNPCEAIQEGELCETQPLEGLEHLLVDGVRYEAFNTSGGLGSLCKTLDGKVRELNYKTIRHQGHRDLMAFLIKELRLGTRRTLLKEILEGAIPLTFQDVVIIVCSVSGERDGRFVQIADARKIYNREIDGETWSAIQITTAAGACAMLDLHVQGALPNRGFVRQEQVGLDAFLANRFGRSFDSPASDRFTFSGVPS